MPEEKLIDPAWLVRARKNRKTFAMRVLIVFGVLTILAWWALPQLENQHAQVVRSLMNKKKDSSTAGPLPVRLLAEGTGVFKVFWVAIAIGCAVGVGLAFTGKIDTFVPVLNIGLLLVGAGALALTFYVFYAPTLLLLEQVK